eukprot:1904121-Karenia_brevis.AAC.1
MSAGFFDPSIFSNPTRLLALTSCIHKYEVSMCLTLPRPFLEIIPSAADASAYTLHLDSSPKSLNAAAMPNPSAVAFTH